MIDQRAMGARFAFARSGRLVSVAGLALLAPLILSGCVSDGDKLSGTADLTPQRSDASKVANAASGAAPAAPKVVEIASADAGPTRVIVPSGRPAAEPVMVAEAKGARVVAAPAPTAAAKPGLASKALGTAVAARDAATDGVVAAKDTVVAGAARVGSGAAAVASASAETVRTVAKAVGDTITGDPKIDELIAEAADENDLPRELAYAVVRVESHYNPRARGAGVYGLSQIKPATARGMGFSGPAEALLDPETNLRYGMRYLKGAYEQGGGDVCQTAMKYKGGHRTTTMSKSASVYCSNVKRHMASIRARKSPAMGEASTLVAAVEPTVRPGLIARTVAAKPAPAKQQTETTATAMAPAAAAPAAGTAQAAVMALPASAPVPAARPAVVRVADNTARPSAQAKPAEGSIGVGSMVGGRVTKHSEPDASRFGGSFDATPPASAAPAGSLGFN
ncbi:transglycosylase SLT domain-containing protein [Aureimonas sp. ME7]|uniref:lytic transglycosylase domain-containing protein n=1 Tax=Aureimonas sp. ME7 TaxID=2744252 RepID=UPI001FCEA091|nr:transglycosylase SLT domain-containing protein [Aureimonas sp. ME7]